MLVEPFGVVPDTPVGGRVAASGRTVPRSPRALTCEDALSRRAAGGLAGAGRACRQDVRGGVPAGEPGAVELPSGRRRGECEWLRNCFPDGDRTIRAGFVRGGREGRSGGT